MKRIAMTTLLLFCLAVPVAAGQENVFSLYGSTYAKTTRVPTTDASQLLTAAFDAAYGSAVAWEPVKAVWITCETNDARISFGVAAENDGTPVGHVLEVGSSMRLPSTSMIQAARIISKTAGSAASLQVSLEY